MKKQIVNINCSYVVVVKGVDTNTHTIEQCKKCEYKNDCYDYLTKTKLKYRIVIRLEEFPSFTIFPSRTVREISIPVSSKDKGIMAYTGLKDLIKILKKE